jgi:hypothetical protein
LNLTEKLSVVSYELSVKKEIRKYFRLELANEHEKQEFDRELTPDN